MDLIKGMPVILVEKTKIGVDGFNHPIYEKNEVIVEDVLVGQPSNDDVINANMLYGKKAIYTLGIPKGDAHIWEDTEVKFFGRTWRTFGIPIQGIEENIPLRWNKKVMVEAYG